MMLSERFGFICCFSSRHFSFVIVKLKFSDFLLNLIISFFNRPFLKRFNFDQPFLSPGVMCWVATKHLGSINQAAMTCIKQNCWKLICWQYKSMFNVYCLIVDQTNIYCMILSIRAERLRKRANFLLHHL